MKQLVFLFAIAFTIFGCKEDKKDLENIQVNEMESSDSSDKTSNDGLTTIGGEFVYFADAAVLQSASGMYGVVIDSKMHELDQMANQYKNEDTDFVPVTVRGKIIPKAEGEEGWDYNIKIVEILKVERPNPDNKDVIKLGTN